jgi:hypothetical protein
MAIVRAKQPGRALQRLRRRLDETLPVDVITTHYPDAHGQVLLNIDFPPAAYARLRAAADREGQPIGIFVQLAIHRALAQHASDETDRLDQAVQHLLASTSASHLLAAVGRALTRLPGASQC